MESQILFSPLDCRLKIRHMASPAFFASAVGEEIEMTPLVFTKGLADPGSWGEKFFGRIMVEEMHLGEGIAHKACRVKVIYGLDPVFESGSTCITKVRNFIAYGTKEESLLIERNQEITKQVCLSYSLIANR